MALQEGTDCGFLSASPSDDPNGVGNTYAANICLVAKFTSPATAAKITEMGFWQNASRTKDVNFEVGLYDASGATVPGEAGALLYSDKTNATGTTAGWKKATGLDWTISPNTVYWLALQIDNDGTENSSFDSSVSGFDGRDRLNGVATLPDPFGGGALNDSDGTYCIYAVWEAAAGTNTSINIGDSWKEIDWANSKINIGDAWKTIVQVDINIGDVWKNVYTA